MLIKEMIFGIVKEKHGVYASSVQIRKIAYEITHLKRFDPIKNRGWYCTNLFTEEGSLRTKYSKSGRYFVPHRKMNGASFFKLIEPAKPKAMGVLLSHAESLEHKGIKPGDRLRVVMKAADYERGWDNTWPARMDDYVGRTMTVKRVNSKRGVYFKESGIYAFPAFVLEVVARAKEQSLPSQINKKEQVMKEVKHPSVHSQFLEEMGLKAGDKVRVLRRGKSNEFGWNDSWVSHAMDSAVGNEYTISSISPSSGVKFEERLRYNFPVTVLEKLESEFTPVNVKLNREYTATITKKNVEVGCQKIPFKVVIELAAAVKKVMETK